MNQPSTEQVNALNQYAKAYGRMWKSELRLAWSAGIYSHALPENCAAYCQQVRNQFGGSWLTKFKANR